MGPRVAYGQLPNGNQRLEHARVATRTDELTEVVICVCTLITTGSTGPWLRFTLTAAVSVAGRSGQQRSWKTKATEFRLSCRMSRCGGANSPARMPPRCRLIYGPGVASFRPAMGDL